MAQIRPVESSERGLGWIVESRSRKEVEHEVIWNRFTHEWECSCEDALYRGKRPNIDDPDWCLCWHMRQVRKLVAPILRACGLMKEKNKDD